MSGTPNLLRVSIAKHLVARVAAWRNRKRDRWQPLPCETGFSRQLECQINRTPCVGFEARERVAASFAQVPGQSCPANGWSQPGYNHEENPSKTVARRPVGVESGASACEHVMLRTRDVSSDPVDPVDPNVTSFPVVSGLKPGASDFARKQSELGRFGPAAADRERRRISETTHWR